MKGHIQTCCWEPPGVWFRKAVPGKGSGWRPVDSAFVFLVETEGEQRRGEWAGGRLGGTRDEGVWGRGSSGELSPRFPSRWGGINQARNPGHAGLEERGQLGFWRRISNPPW